MNKTAEVKAPLASPSPYIPPDAILPVDVESERHLRSIGRDPAQYAEVCLSVPIQGGGITHLPNGEKAMVLQAPIILPASMVILPKVLVTEAVGVDVAQLLQVRLLVGRDSLQPAVTAVLAEAERVLASLEAGAGEAPVSTLDLLSGIQRAREEEAG